MKNLRVLRFATLLTLLALALAAPATALPRPCDAICDCDSTCWLLCTTNGNIVTSCGGYGQCNTRCFAASGSQKNDSSTLLNAIFTQPENDSTPTASELIAQPDLSAVATQSH